MSVKRSSRKINFPPEQRAEHGRIRELFKDWHPSPEELLASKEGEQFTLFGEYPYLRALLTELKQVRVQAGLSLTNVSRRSGIDKAALSRLENGQNANPTLDTLLRYAAAVGKRLLFQTETIVSTKPSASGSNAVVRRPRKHVGKG
jgi:DNA-binding phage protein